MGNRKYKPHKRKNNKTNKWHESKLMKIKLEIETVWLDINFKKKVIKYLKKLKDELK